MSETAQEKVTIQAPITNVIDVIANVEAYPEWVSDMTEVEVIERDEQGRPATVRYGAALAGRTVSYTLEYDWTEAPAKISWNQTEGNLTSKLDGSYQLVETGDGTEVAYQLEIDLRAPIPSFVKRRAEGKIIRSALIDLRERVETPTK